MLLDTFLRSYFWVFRLGVLFAAAYLLAHTANVFVGEALRVPPSQIAAGPRGPPVQAHRPRTAPSERFTAAFLERNLFKAAREDIAPKPKEPAGAKREEATHGPLVINDENCPPSALRARLLATFVSDGRPDLSVAVLRATKEEENTIALRPGDQVLATADLLFVDFRKIYVNNKGRCESLSLERQGTTPHGPRTSRPPVHYSGFSHNH